MGIQVVSLYDDFILNLRLFLIYFFNLKKIFKNIQGFEKTNCWSHSQNPKKMNDPSYSKSCVELNSVGLYSKELAKWMDAEDNDFENIKWCEMCG